MVGKGRSSLEKIFSVIGLNSPVTKNAFAEHTIIIESKAHDLLQTNLTEAASRVKEVASEIGEYDEKETLDVGVF